ncbi:hypothetical protein EVAR_80056_1 [Eumeta japonica]|uniref:Uncharacterized protein n=1 Tax=Eumeta variegata TaxID=151549 RepID=A0A4C1WL24_EUMVA|nr:hypothetical protein EVAR_80056_1 [Eumeta japonica]
MNNVLPEGMEIPSPSPILSQPRSLEDKFSHRQVPKHKYENNGLEQSVDCSQGSRNRNPLIGVPVSRFLNN